MNIYFSGSKVAKAQCTVSCGESDKMTAVSTTILPHMSSQEAVPKGGAKMSYSDAVKIGPVKSLSVIRQKPVIKVSVSGRNIS